MFLRIVLLVVGLSLLLGCGTIRSIPHLATNELALNISENSTTINEAYTRATNAVILKNILRSRDDWPTGYTTLSGITANPKIVFSAGGSFAPLGLGNPALPFGASSAELEQANTADASYKVNPFAEKDGQNNVFFPLPAPVFQEYWNSGFSRELLAALFIDSYTDNSGYVVFNDPENPSAFLTDLKGMILGDNPAEFFELIKNSNEKCEKFEKKIQTNDLLKVWPIKDGHVLKNLEMLKKIFGDKIIFGLSDIDDGGMEVEFCTTKFEYVFIKRNKKVDTKNASLESICTVPSESYDNKLNFRLFSSEEAADNEPNKGSIKLRSIDQVINYVGRSLRAEDKNGQLNDCALVIDGKSKLFCVRKKGALRNLTGGLVDRFAASARHGGDLYFAGEGRPISHGSEKRGEKAARSSSESICVNNDCSGAVLRVLTQLYLRSQSEAFLKAPETSVLRTE